MRNNKFFFVKAAVLLVFGVVFAACGGKKSSGGAASGTKTSGEAFNLDLPLTYNVPTAFANRQGLPSLSAKSLFNEANFMNKSTTTVICESQTAKNGTFTGVLLLSDEGEKRLRMTISLHPDSDGEFLYITEVSVKNLESGEVSSMNYDGSQCSAANVAGLFVGMLDYFYDKDKLLAK